MSKKITTSSAILVLLSFASPQAISSETLQALPYANFDRAAAHSGEIIFSSKDVSASGASCSSCHNLKTFGVDKLPLAAMPDGSSIVVNTPTVLNAANNKYYGWAGEKHSLTDFITSHINDQILGTDSSTVLMKILSSPTIRQQISSRPVIKFDDISLFLASYITSLSTPSKFDRYLNGDKAALNSDELAGYANFKEYGCIGCHFGANVGGSALDAFGGMRRYFGREPAAVFVNDMNGKSYTAKLTLDAQVLRPPSLRNVANTSPYFHDGSAKTLHDAVSTMLKYQVGRSASEQEKTQIILFLKTLSAE